MVARKCVSFMAVPEVTAVVNLFKPTQCVLYDKLFRFDFSARWHAAETCVDDKANVQDVVLLELSN